MIRLRVRSQHVIPKDCPGPCRGKRGEPKQRRGPRGGPGEKGGAFGSRPLTGDLFKDILHDGFEVLDRLPENQRLPPTKPIQTWEPGTKGPPPPGGHPLTGDLFTDVFNSGWGTASTWPYPDPPVDAPSSATRKKRAPRDAGL